MSTKKTIQRKLSREERNRIESAIARAKRDSKVPATAQQTIPYLRMHPDGICQATDALYTKTIQFQDINYQLAQNEDKTAIFDGWCDFLNYFDSSIRFQFSFLNLSASIEEFEQSILIPDQNDDFDDIREEYANMLRGQLAKGNNGLSKTKFITFGIEAENLRTAKPRLERIENDLLNSFKRLGVAADPLSGKDRLKLLHSIYHLDGQERFLFDWDWLPLSGLSTKDYIAPSSFDFTEALKRSSPVPISFEAMPASTDGYFSQDRQKIAIREDMSEIQTVSAAIHEIVIAKLHNQQPEKAQDHGEAGKAPEKPKDRRTEEVEAESVSFAVCAYYGIATDENSFGYIAAWSKDKDLPELKASLETISKTSAELIDDIDRHFTEITKDRGITTADIGQQDEKTGTDDNPSPRLQEVEFLTGPDDTYAIYQLKNDENLRNHQFESLHHLQKLGLTVDYKNYDLTYTGHFETAACNDPLCQDTIFGLTSIFLSLLFQLTLVSG